MIPDPASFLDRLFTHLARLGLDSDALQADHLCYRVADPERYRNLKAWAATRGQLLGEHPVGGRAIATFRLHDPYPYGPHRFALMELPAPKAGSPYAEGWEHAEFVLREDPRAWAATHPDIPWDTTALGGNDGGELRVRFGDISAKFRRRGLAEVIAEEQA